MEADASAIRPGDVVGGRYRIEEEIGAGAMGQVYRVVHQTLELPLALKILHPELAVVPEVRQRLEREARLSAWLDHPAVVQIIDFGEHNGRPYLVMRLVEGEELSVRLERGPIPPDEVVDLGVALCSGLAHAHGLGLIHRDLKPENVVLTARGLRILDFGLARAIASDDPRLTRTGLVCGTPRYMSPEQAAGDPVDVRSDIYAVGVLLHEMLRGEPLFDGPNAAAVLRRQIVDAPPKLELKRDRTVDVERIRAVVEKALSKEPALRQPDAVTLEAELAACRRKPARPWGRMAAAMALLALLGVGAFAASRVLGDPLLEAKAALAAGQLDIAERSLKARLRGRPSDADAKMLMGRIAYARGEMGMAAREWTAALTAEPDLTGEPALLDLIPATVVKLQAGERRDRARARALVETVGRVASESGVALLAALVEEAPRLRMRRKAYEGLERLGAIDAVDAFGFLAGDLEAQRTSSCPIRKWYVTRLAELGDPRADAVVEAERKKRRSSCLSDL